MDFVRMDRSALPPEEHQAAWEIESNLSTIQMLSQEFRQSAHLYLFSHGRQTLHADQLRDMIGLQKIAGRNGAVVAYSFARIMEAINSTKAPTIWAKADKAERTKATKLFAREFPSIEHIRHSAAHPGELRKNPAERARHELKGPIAHRIIQSTGGGVYIESAMEAGPDSLVFSATIYGELREYQLSLAKADVLDTVANHYFRTFYPLEDTRQAGGARFLREIDEQSVRDQRLRPPWWHSLLLP